MFWIYITIYIITNWKHVNLVRIRIHIFKFIICNLDDQDHQHIINIFKKLGSQGL